MADFAVWAMACEGVFTQPGSFMADFKASANEVIGPCVFLSLNVRPLILCLGRQVEVATISRADG
jgi:hypothetical protein